VSPLDVGDGSGDKQTCKAFPTGIPDDIWWNVDDHRQPVEGDHGVQWDPLDGAEFPEWAMADATQEQGG
jgi:hypothetical protein